MRLSGKTPPETREPRDPSVPTGTPPPHRPPARERDWARPAVAMATGRPVRALSAKAGGTFAPCFLDVWDSVPQALCKS